MSKVSNVIGGFAGVAGFLTAYALCPGSEVGKTAAGATAGVMSAAIVDGTIDLTVKAVKGVVRCVDVIVGEDPEIREIKKKYATVNAVENTDTTSEEPLQAPDVDTQPAEPPQVQEEVQPQPDESVIPGSVADVLTGNG